MKKLNLTEQKGVAQIFLLVGMLLVAISMPLATKLVQQNQENRSNAATKIVYVCYKGNAQGARAVGNYNTLSNCKSKCSGGSCQKKTVNVVTTSTGKAGTKFDGACGSAKNSCLSKGKMSDVADTSDYYVWVCNGSEYGIAKTCKLKKPTTSSPTTSSKSTKPTCSSKGGYCVASSGECSGHYINSNNVSDCGGKKYCCLGTAKTTSTKPTCSSKGGSCVATSSECSGNYINSNNVSDCGGKKYCCLGTAKNTTSSCTYNSKYYKNGKTICIGAQVAECVVGGASTGPYWKYSDCPGGCDVKTGECVKVATVVNDGDGTASTSTKPTCSSKGGSCVATSSECSGNYINSNNVSDCGGKKYCCLGTAKNTTSGCFYNSKYYKNGETICIGAQVAECVVGGASTGPYWKYSDCPGVCDVEIGECVEK